MQRLYKSIVSEGFEQKYLFLTYATTAQELRHQVIVGPGAQGQRVQTSTSCLAIMVFFKFIQVQQNQYGQE